MKKTLSILFVALFTLSVLGLAVMSVRQHRQKVVRHVRVHLYFAAGQKFMTIDQVNKMMHSSDSIIGKPVKSIAVHSVEKQVDRNPFVKSVDVYFNILGDLTVNVYEKEAVMRIFNQKNQSCYVDKSGDLFPLTGRFSARVIPVNGYLSMPLRMGKNVSDSLYARGLLPGLYRLVRQIDKNPFLKAAISQIFVNSRGKIDLIPEVGSHLIRFGKLEDINIKLENLEAFYKQALVKEGWNKYKSINLAFVNQVVCTKK